MFDQLPAKVVRLQIVVGAQRVDDPHLIARAAGGNVETLFEKFLVAQGKGAMLGGIHKRNKNNVALVALELGGVSAKHAVQLVPVGRDMRANEIVNLNRLFVTHQRYHTEAERLSRIIFLILRLLNRRSDQRCNGKGFLAIDFAIATGTRHAVSDCVRPQMHAACVAQRLDTAIIRNHVTELNNLWDAAEMFDKASRTAERLARQIVNGNLAIIQIEVRNTPKILVNQISNPAQLLPA